MDNDNNYPLAIHGEGVPAKRAGVRSKNAVVIPGQNNDREECRVFLPPKTLSYQKAGKFGETNYASKNTPLIMVITSYTSENVKPSKILAFMNMSKLFAMESASKS